MAEGAALASRCTAAGVLCRNIPSYHWRVPTRFFHVVSARHPYADTRRVKAATLGRRTVARALPSDSENHPWQVEEARWQREETRWLREEQRWLREEQRWQGEKAQLEEQIRRLTAALLEALEVGRRGTTASAGESSIDVQVRLRALGLIPAEPSEALTLPPAGAPVVVPLKQAAVADTGLAPGSDGHIPEKPLQASTPPAKPHVKPPEPTIEKPEIERYARSKLEFGEHRVFLLGENRWEDPSRLSRGTPASTPSPASSSNSPSRGPLIPTATLQAGNGGITSAVGGLEGSAVQGGLRLVVSKTCLQCRGDGWVTCLECEGTGELNVEEQFLEWVGEGAKCMYCDGIGALKCDVCDGEGQTQEES